MTLMEQVPGPVCRFPARLIVPTRTLHQADPKRHHREQHARHEVVSWSAVHCCSLPPVHERVDGSQSPSFHLTVYNAPT